MDKDCFLDTMKYAINSGRSQMKSEILTKIWDLVEQASLRKDEALLMTLYWVYGQLQTLPSRIEDKSKATAEEAANDK